MARLTKCQVCGELVEDKFTIYYINKNGNESKKNGHKQCVENWHKDYVEFNEFENVIIRVTEAPTLSKQFITRIRELHKDYSYSIITKTVMENSKAIRDNFHIGWNYVFGIINNSIAQVYVANKKKAQQLIQDTKQEDIIIFDTNKAKKNDNTDYSKLFD